MLAQIPMICSKVYGDSGPKRSKAAKNGKCATQQIKRGINQRVPNASSVSLSKNAGQVSNSTVERRACTAGIVLLVSVP